MFEPSEQSENVEYLYLYQEADKNDNYARINLNIENRGTTEEKVNISYFVIEYTKPLDNRAIFALSARSSFEDREFVFPIARSNKDFNFDFNVSQYYAGAFIDKYDKEMQQPLYYVKDGDGNSVYFEDASRNYEYDAEGNYFRYGNFVYIVDKDGNKTDTSEKYDMLTVRDMNNGWAIFDETGKDLSETVQNELPRGRAVGVSKQT